MGALSLDKDDHFLTGLKSFMSRELSRMPWCLLAADLKKLVLHFEQSDFRGSLCWDSEELVLDGITWAVGIETSERLGLNDEVPLEVEWSGGKKFHHVSEHSANKNRSRLSTTKKLNIMCWHRWDYLKHTWFLIHERPVYIAVHQAQATCGPPDLIDSSSLIPYHLMARANGSQSNNICRVTGFLIHVVY